LPGEPPLDLTGIPDVPTLGITAKDVEKLNEVDETAKFNLGLMHFLT